MSRGMLIDHIHGLAKYSKEKGDSCVEKGKLDEAENYYKDAVATYEQLFERGLMPVFKELIETYECLINLYEKTNQKETADLFREKKEKAIAEEKQNDN